MEGRAQPQASNESGGPGSGVGEGDAASKAENSIAYPPSTNASSISNNSSSSSSSSSTADNLQLRKRDREAAHERSHVEEQKIRDDVGRPYQEQAPPGARPTEIKTAPDQLAYEPRRQPGVTSEAANAAASGGWAISANKTDPDQVSSVAEERSQRRPGVGSVPANASSNGLGVVVPADALAGAHQASSAAVGGIPVVKKSRTMFRYGFSVVDQLAARAARHRKFKARPQHAEAAASYPIPATDVASAEMVEMLIQDRDTSKLVFEGTNLSREYVFGLLLERPVMYEVDPVAQRAVAVFANEEAVRASYNHLRRSYKRYGWKVKAFFPWGFQTCDLT
jgi:hypothetical protein